MIFDLYTDGGCQRPDGPGGWAYCIIDHSKDKPEVHMGSGNQGNTTSNQMEMTAVIEGLLYIAKLDPTLESRINLVSDSEYVVNGLNEWLPGWVARCWCKSDGKPIKNEYYWKHIHLLANHVYKDRLTVIWTKGHAGNYYNEICDKLASEQIRKLRVEIGELNEESP